MTNSRYEVDSEYEIRNAPGSGPENDYDGEQFDRADRQSLRRVAGLSTELQDVTEVE